MTTINELMKTNIITLDADDPLSKAMALFKDHDTIIVTKKDYYQGVVKKNNVMIAKLPLETKVGGLTVNVPKITDDLPIPEIARLMMESDSYELPILDKHNKIEGVIRIDDVLTSTLAEEFKDTPLTQVMSFPVTTITPDDTIGKAIKMFKEKDISRLPVMDRDGIIGILTMDDIINSVVHPESKPEGWARYGAWIGEKKEYLTLPVKGFMKEHVPILSKDDSVHEALKQLHKFHYRGLMIGNGKTLDGIITKKDLLEPLLSFQIQEPMYVQFAGELDTIEGFNKKEGREYLQGIFEKYQEYLDNANVYVYLKQHKETNRGLPLIYCKIRFSSPRGMFIASEDGWGFSHALNNATKIIDRQIRDSKPR